MNSIRSGKGRDGGAIDMLIEEKFGKEACATLEGIEWKTQDAQRREELQQLLQDYKYGSRLFVKNGSFTDNEFQEAFSEEAFSEEQLTILMEVNHFVRNQKKFLILKNDLALLRQRFGTTPRRVIGKYIELPNPKMTYDQMNEDQRSLDFAGRFLFSLMGSDDYFSDLTTKYGNKIPEKESDILRQMEMFIRCMRQIHVIKHKTFIDGSRLRPDHDQGILKLNEGRKYASILNYFDEFGEEPLIGLTAEFAAELQKKYKAWLKWLDRWNRQQRK